ncbi:MAG TPA: hypothetical protein PJ982_19780, partial [Lacipirellulaceae bacterium]|nr:hypothetical protein [Lacipirellulaceae bacterium]
MAKTSGAAPKAQQPQPSDGGNKPVETIRYRNLRASIWRNEGANGPFHSVTFTRSYRDEQEQWHDAASFNTSDLPMLAKLANDAHSWITREERRQQQQ